MSEGIINKNCTGYEKNKAAGQAKSMKWFLHYSGEAWHFYQD